MRAKTKRIIMGLCMLGGHIIGASLASSIQVSPFMESKSPLFRGFSALLVDGMYTGLGYTAGKIICSEFDTEGGEDNGTGTNGVSIELEQES